MVNQLFEIPDPWYGFVTDIGKITEPKTNEQQFINKYIIRAFEMSVKCELEHPEKGSVGREMLIKLLEKNKLEKFTK
jgi:hypothetical protein